MPGHERFVHNMVAGVGGIDLVLLVVAADEGVMPQTREHLDICRLLGVQRGLVVLTKADLVEPDWLEMVQEDVRGFLRGTFLEGCADAPRLRHDRPGHPGVARGDRRARAGRARARNRRNLPPADRSVFTMKGFGTVVTGTLMAGSSPSARASRCYHRAREPVRGIQVYGRSVEAAAPASARRSTSRAWRSPASSGGRSCAGRRSSNASRSWTPVGSCLKPPTAPTGTRVRLHLGTSEVLARVNLWTEDAIAPGKKSDVQFRLESPGVALPRDRYVIRGYSPS